MAKRRAPVMKVEKDPAKMARSANRDNIPTESRQKCRDTKSPVKTPKNPDIDSATIIGNPDGAEVLASLFTAVGVKVVTVKERPDSDDPSAMLGPLVPEDPEEEDDDTPGGM